MMNKPTVLVVDDSVSIRKQVRAILEKQGYDVREAGNRIGMLNKLEEYGVPVTLVIMDLSLNAEHGFDLVRTLRETPGHSELPVIILTETADRMTVLTAKSLGVSGYIVKPVTADILLERCTTARNSEAHAAKKTKSSSSSGASDGGSG